MSKLKPASDKPSATVRHVQGQCSPADIVLEEAISGAGRRQIIKDIIVSHFLSATTRKLKLVDVANRAGITRQALDRYYSDLKPYIAGKKDFTDLVHGSEAKARAETQATINSVDSKWKARMEQSQIEQDKEIAKAIHSHITTLMNGDIAIFESNQLRKTLEKQTLYGAELKKTNAILELKLATSAHRDAPTSSPSRNTKIIYDVDIEQLCIQYQRTRSLDAFEDAKELELRAIREKFARFASTPHVHVVLFAERYISRFSQFAANYLGPSDETSLIIRLPLFTRVEINNFIKHIPANFKKSLYVPYMQLDVERKAQRVFIFQQNSLPPQEIQAADGADTPNMSWGLDQIVFCKTRQGD
ncbi:hypothetical protein [Pseudomonas psychrophila]|uniref:Uncharacterized protein n=1 Tax=Pseudomonas psychrophila TaxID=122355 RepID=A0ABY0VR14_9PSED|nr:hypothetical protein [Pseudomonas psychrophila]KAB0486049.1 hypothetical protein F7Q95_21045 [Pseudomonas psychrophila]KMN02486.1 hypothetical protein TU76_01480 [Pseudomonas psychrophila]QIE32545.1 hypothetical protein G5J76_09955 [Pseudomonas psychrophila]WVI99091.1 hypothetical protein VR624_07005 [Pseudomonas psychrophila]SDU50074.1 hypothetical protein SAMN04490201_2087 [Pseudomonas psychrophila]